ncbi:RNA ligase family protein [Microbacterium sp. M]|uniref:RNA ligase family protein n=1 Tax=Microbacterium sp. M TaxID=3377125 RepID=UPI00386E5CE6
MTALEFQPWPKIARLNRDITITEKIDGTNAAVVIVPVEANHPTKVVDGETLYLQKVTTPVISIVVDNADGQEYFVLAQSRTRFITPDQDNYGFARWVERNAPTLVEVLGAGTHFGEWWGAGIQRKYGLTGSDKRFSLFNTGRWATLKSEVDMKHTHPVNFEAIPELHHVPVLYRGNFNEEAIIDAEEWLRRDGSFAAPGFMRPEGIVVWHDAARQSFKVTLEGDEAPKGQEAHRFDEEIAA